MVKSYHSLPLSGPRTSDFYCQVDIGNKIDSRERHSSVSCKNQTQQDNLELMAQLTFQICLDLKFVFESQFFNDRSFKFSNNLPFHFLSITQLGNSSYAKSLIIVWNLGKFGTRPKYWNANSTNLMSISHINAMIPKCKWCKLRFCVENGKHFCIS